MLGRRDRRRDKEGDTMYTVQHYPQTLVSTSLVRFLFFLIEPLHPFYMIGL